MALIKLNSRAIPDNTVVNTDIADGSVTQAKIVDGSISCRLQQSLQNLRVQEFYW